MDVSVFYLFLAFLLGTIWFKLPWGVQFSIIMLVVGWITMPSGGFTMKGAAAGVILMILPLFAAVLPRYLSRPRPARYLQTAGVLMPFLLWVSAFTVMIAALYVGERHKGTALGWGAFFLFLFAPLAAAITTLSWRSLRRGISDLLPKESP